MVGLVVGVSAYGVSLLLFPPNRGLGQSPNFNPERFSFRGTSKLKAASHHDELELLGSNPPGF